MKILLINGPNLNLLGMRNPNEYGNFTLEQIESKLREQSKELNCELFTYQSNIEGEIIDKIQSANNEYDGIILNAGGYTHTSVAIRDAIEAISIPVIEIHLSNISAREEFRQTSLISPVCIGQISGFKENSYKLGLIALIDYLKSQNSI